MTQKIELPPIGSTPAWLKAVLSAQVSIEQDGPGAFAVRGGVIPHESGYPWRPRLSRGGRWSYEPTLSSSRSERFKERHSFGSREEASKALAKAGPWWLEVLIDEA